MLSNNIHSKLLALAEAQEAKHKQYKQYDHDGIKHWESPFLCCV